MYNESMFLIKTIIESKVIDGDTIIKAVSIPDGIDVEIIVPSRLGNDKEYVRDKLLSEYKFIIKRSESNNITVGTIL